MRKDLTEPVLREAEPVPTTQVASLRSDGFFVWQTVKVPVAPSYTEPKDLWPTGKSVSREEKEEYDKSVKSKQAEHMRAIERNKPPAWRPCLHDSCPNCLGTGSKIDGSPCVHDIKCPCPRCN